MRLITLLRIIDPKAIQNWSINYLLAINDKIATVTADNQFQSVANHKRDRLSEGCALSINYSFKMNILYFQLAKRSAKKKKNVSNIHWFWRDAKKRLNCFNFIFNFSIVVVSLMSIIILNDNYWLHIWLQLAMICNKRTMELM